MRISSRLQLRKVGLTNLPVHLQWRVANWSRSPQKLLSPPFEACGYTWYELCSLCPKMSGCSDVVSRRVVSWHFGSRSLCMHACVPFETWGCAVPTDVNLHLLYRCTLAFGCV